MADENIEVNNSYNDDDDDISDMESLEFLKRKRLSSSYLYKYFDYKYKYNTLKLVCIAIICLLLGLFIGSFIQETLSIYYYNNDDIDISKPDYIFPDNVDDDDIDSAVAASAGFGGFNGGISGGIKKKRKKRRKNEEICSQRRCCYRRDGVLQSSIPNGIRCKTLSDIECGGLYDDYCDWDCDRQERLRNGQRNGKRNGNGEIRRKYVGISYEEGSFQLPNDIGKNDDNKKPELLDEALKYGKFISIDDCGVMYEEEIPQEIIKNKFFKNINKKYDFSSKKANGFNYSDSEIEPVGYDDDKRKLVVLGSDDREQVTSSSFPWRAVLYMNVDVSSGATGRCTATMISDRYAITAAHCVWGNGDWYGNFKLYKNVFSCNDRTSSNMYTTNQRVVFTAWQDTQSVDYDIAWLRLTTDSGLGYFDFGYDTDLLDLTTDSSFNIISYPADKSDCSKWRQYCPYDTFFTHTMRTDECDTSGGASGSGVYKYWSSSSQRTIYAIHAYGSTSYNTAIMITQSKYNAICSYVESIEYDGWCDDEHPTFN